jgi:glycosyltransferase involved in cell wall biosynthesis
MKLLYFAPHQAWPLNTGARLRDYHLARQLAARSSLTFVEMRRESEKHRALPDDSGFDGLLTLCKDGVYTPSKIVRGLAGPVPITVLNCWSPRAASRLTHLLRSRPFDTVQIEGLPLMEYLPLVERAPGISGIVVDWHNIESEIMWRYSETCGNWAKKVAARRTAKLLENAEERLLQSDVIHTVTSERERTKLLARSPAAIIHVLRNGVDAGLYSPEQISKAYAGSRPRNLKSSLVFVGSMDYHANIDAVISFARKAWPQIAQNHPELHFTIVGRDPSPEVRALSSSRIHVTGSVDDVRPYYATALAAVVPLRSGSGTRLKILEAMAAGVPVVSTRLGAEGIEGEANTHFFIASDEREMVAAVKRIVSSVEVRCRMVHQARELVRKVYDWGIIGTQLCDLHQQIALSRARSVLRKVS